VKIRFWFTAGSVKAPGLGVSKKEWRLWKMSDGGPASLGWFGGGETWYVLLDLRFVCVCCPCLYSVSVFFQPSMVSPVPGRVGWDQPRPSAASVAQPN
jgi:hypothetical protein